MYIRMVMKLVYRKQRQQVTIGVGYLFPLALTSANTDSARNPRSPLAYASGGGVRDS